MNKLQKLIEVLKLKISEAGYYSDKCSEAKILDDARYWAGRLRAYEIALYEAELLLNSENENSGEKDGQTAAMQNR